MQFLCKKNGSNAYHCLNNMQFCENNVGICMHVTSKHHVVALHFTCMGTSRISSVSARHGFEQVVFLGRLSTMVIGVYPKKYIGGMSTILSDFVQ